MRLSRLIIVIVSALLAIGLVTVGIVVALGGAFVAERPASESDSSASGGTEVPTEDDDDFGTVEVYAVLDDGSLDPGASGLTAEVWDTFTRVAGTETTAAIMTQFRVGDAPDSDTLAYVYQDDDPQYWVLAANLATSDDPSQLIATLVHEYAHILTLGVDELDLDAASCELQLDEGCADGSILGAFEQEFWSGYTDAPDPANTDSDLAYDFYLAHEDDFVSDYAATNVVEDIAESFMTWVIEDDPSGTSVIAQKMAFFERYPQLVAERDRIRAEFADDLGLAN
jgi:hypothetical protein